MVFDEISHCVKVNLSAIYVNMLHFQDLKAFILLSMINRKRTLWDFQTCAGWSGYHFHPIIKSHSETEKCIFVLTTRESVKVKVTEQSFLCFPTWKYIKILFKFIFQPFQKINAVVLQNHQQMALLHNTGNRCLEIIFELQPTKDLSYYWL